MVEEQVWKSMLHEVFSVAVMWERVLAAEKKDMEFWGWCKFGEWLY
jgi:hypothetical protein